MQRAKTSGQDSFRNHADWAFSVAGATMNAFLLVYLISAIAKTNGLGRAECFAHLAADALFSNKVYFGPFGEAGLCCCACSR